MSETYETATTWAEPTTTPLLTSARLSPNLFVGVASPLWAYYGVAAAGAVALWWMRQWVGAPKNLEAMFAPTPSPVAPVSHDPTPEAHAAAPQLALAAPTTEEPVGFALVDAIAEAHAVQEDVAATVAETVREGAETALSSLSSVTETTVDVSSSLEPETADAVLEKPTKRHTPKLPAREGSEG